VILVDTSVWVDYLRGRRTTATDLLRAAIGRGEELAITEPIAMELMAGADTPARVVALERLTTGLPVLGVEPALDFHAAAGMYLLARQSGRTVRSLVDCLVAAVAIRRDVVLLHDDRDYESLAAVTTLSTLP
jgi:predicted nucleic acid-binding protein